MFLRHGKVIAEGWWNPYKPELRHTLYSTSKSFTATAVGFAVSENRLSVNDKVVSFFPDELPDSVSPYPGRDEGQGFAKYVRRTGPRSNI